MCWAARQRRADTQSAATGQLGRRHDPELREAFKRVPGRALGDAARLKEEIEERTGRSVWVQAVVVLWSEFPEGFVQAGKCVLFIEGPRLRDWLEGRPLRLSEGLVREIGEGVAGIAEGPMLRPSPPARQFAAH